jgi:hypothetical protein
MRTLRGGYGGSAREGESVTQSHTEAPSLSEKCRVAQGFNEEG